MMRLLYHARRSGCGEKPAFITNVLRVGNGTISLRNDYIAASQFSTPCNMYLMRKTLLTTVLFCSAFLLSAQQLPKTLLWRITGKGLSTPSYLYGTMHLNDQRLFNFGDSVYRAIERCDGLAIEISPDEICAEMLTRFFDQKDNGKKLKDILGEKDFKVYSEALEKKFGKPADEITARDLVSKKNSWVNELMEKGEMSTFMDAWLYNVARRQGKWLGGIEDMSDQADLEEELVDVSDVMYLVANDSTQDRENNAMLEKMVNIYITQDLDKVAEIADYKSAREKDLVLTRRNLKMARRIDSLTALRSMFLAVGLAHLPGDSGVIKLLQKRGFKVEPVFSKNKIAAKDYTFKEIQIPWVNVKDEQGLYSVQMPGNPATRKYEELMEMKFLFDLFNMSGFCTMTVINPYMENSDSLLNEVAKGFMQGEKPSSVKDLHREGARGREYFHKDGDSHMRLQVFATDKVLYLVLMAGLKETSLTSADAEKFFNSFQIHKPVATNKNITASTFTDSVMGITMQTKVKLVADKKYSPEDNQDFKVTGFAGSDVESGSFVLLFSREVKPGYYIVSDSVIFDEIEKQMLSQYENVKKKTGKFQGYPSMTLTGRYKEAEDVYAKTFSVLKDNRSLILIVAADSLHMFNGSLDVYFNTLRYIDQPKLKWNFHNAPDKSYTVWTPTPLRDHNDKGTPYKIAYDTLTATSFFVSVDTIRKYYWAASDSAFWEDMIGVDTDSLIRYNKITKNGEFEGRETFSSLDEGRVYNRVRMIPNGNLVYKIFCAASEPYLTSDDANKFFDSFRLQVQKQPLSYRESKAKMLLDDLASEDSATRTGAFHSLDAAVFTAEHLPGLQQALLKEYRDVNGMENAEAIYDELARKIAAFKDETVVDLIRQHYPAFKKGPEGQHTAALSILAKMQTEKSYTAFTELLLQSVPAKKAGYWVLRALQDSLALTARFYPQWQQLAADSVFGPTVADLALKLVDSGHIKNELVAGAAGEFMKAARELEKKMKADPDFFEYWIYDLLSVAARFNTPEANKLLLDFTKGHSKYLHKHAVLLLLKNKQQVPAAVLDSLAADKDIRTVFYADLKERKKTNLFPKKYFTQAYFAESEMHQVANDEATASSIEFVQKKKGIFKGKTYQFYLYKVTYEGGEDETWSHLGIIGGYDLAGKNPEYQKWMGDILSDDEFDPNRIAEQFDAFLKRMEEYE